MSVFSEEEWEANGRIQAYGWEISFLVDFIKSLPNQDYVEAYNKMVNDINNGEPRSQERIDQSFDYLASFLSITKTELFNLTYKEYNEKLLRCMSNISHPSSFDVCDEILVLKSIFENTYTTQYQSILNNGTTLTKGDKYIIVGSVFSIDNHCTEEYLTKSFQRTDSEGNTCNKEFNICLIQTRDQTDFFLILSSDSKLNHKKVTKIVSKHLAI